MSFFTREMEMRYEPRTRYLVTCDYCGTMRAIFETGHDPIKWGCSCGRHLKFYKNRNNNFIGWGDNNGKKI